MKVKGSDIVRDISRNLNVERRKLSFRSRADIDTNLLILELALETRSVLIEKDFTKIKNEDD